MYDFWGLCCREGLEQVGRGRFDWVIQDVQPDYLFLPAHGGIVTLGLDSLYADPTFRSRYRQVAAFGSGSDTAVIWQRTPIGTPR